MTEILDSAVSEIEALSPFSYSNGTQGVVLTLNQRVQGISRLELIVRLGQEWLGLQEKYPGESDTNGWRKLAVGIAIAALAERRIPN